MVLLSTDQTQNTVHSFEHYILRDKRKRRSEGEKQESYLKYCRKMIRLSKSLESEPVGGSQKEKELLKIEY